MDPAALYAQVLRDTSRVRDSPRSPRRSPQSAQAPEQQKLPLLGPWLAGWCGVEQNAGRESTFGSQTAFGSSLSLTMCTILGKFLLLPGWLSGLMCLWGVELSSCMCDSELPSARLLARHPEGLWGTDPGGYCLQATNEETGSRRDAQG